MKSQWRNITINFKIEEPYLHALQCDRVVWCNVSLEQLWPGGCSGNRDAAIHDPVYTQLDLWFSLYSCLLPSLRILRSEEPIYGWKSWWKRKWYIIDKMGPGPNGQIWALVRWSSTNILTSPHWIYQQISDTKVIKHKMHLRHETMSADCSTKFPLSSGWTQHGHK